MENPQPGPIEAFQGQVRALMQKECLVQRSFVHPSYANERNLEPQESYERLEYLGDALLTAVVSEYLFLRFGRLNEGALTMIRAGLVNEGSLAGLARALGLDRLVLLGRGEERSGGRQKPSILCDVFEALVGALFLELGYDKLKDLLLPLFDAKAQALVSLAEAKDEKSQLQELTHALCKEAPVYKEAEESGEFLVRVFLRGRLLGEGRAANKKEASRRAARVALSKLKEGADAY
jgi:ribonuclease-3